MTIDDLKKVLEGSDLGAVLPDLNAIVDKMTPIMRIALLAGPIILLALGLIYLFASPKEANYKLGYRCYFGMGSVNAWRYTQRLAGLAWSVLGLILTGAMVLLTNGFADMDVYDAVWTAAKYVLWEVVIVALSCLCINTIVMSRFTYNGDYRKARKRR